MSPGVQSGGQYNFSRPVMANDKFFSVKDMSYLTTTEGSLKMQYIRKHPKHNRGGLHNH